LEQVMVCRDEDLADVDLYDDGTFPSFRWKQAPKGLATRRQLRAWACGLVATTRSRRSSAEAASASRPPMFLRQSSLKSQTPA
jgi:hypothetical protein